MNRSDRDIKPDNRQNRMAWARQLAEQAPHEIALVLWMELVNSAHRLATAVEKGNPNAASKLYEACALLEAATFAGEPIEAAKQALESELNDTREFDVHDLPDEIRDELLTRLVTTVVGAICRGPRGE